MILMFFAARREEVRSEGTEISKDRAWPAARLPARDLRCEKSKPGEAACSLSQEGQAAGSDQERQGGMTEVLSARRSVVSFSAIMASAKFEIFICRDPYHTHQTPVQEMTAVEYRGHHVAITRDGSSYSVRIDRDPLTDQHNLNAHEVIAYVEGNT